MTRINALSSMKETNSMTWGKTISANASVLIFAAVLIVCSVTVGCSSSNDNDKPKPVSTNNQIPVTQPQAAAMPIAAPVAQPVSKPVQRKAPKKAVTVNYTDKTYGVTFEYPRRYAIETGDAAAELLLSHPVPMNFVQPGGVALAAVELPETNFANTDFSSAFFNVSVHKTLTADQCSEFSVPQPKSTETPAVKPESPAVTSTTTEVAKQETAATAKSDSKSDTQPATAQPAPSTDLASTVKSSTPSSTESASNSKLMIGDLELRSTEAVAGEGTRQSDSKYFHVYQNGACYEFALNVTTDASEAGVVKHVDRDKVFNRLEQILSTVKLTPVAAPEVAAEAPKPAVPESPAQ